MNPYDFARIDWGRPPERRKPIWHHRLVGPEGQKLYAGQLEIDIFVETPLFIIDPRAASTDPKKAALSLRNKQGRYILPGSSLKGMLRNVYETLGNGCLTLFDGTYEGKRVDYTREVPAAFQHCEDNTNLCIACRSFGMLKERQGGVLLGKVTIGDALVDQEKTYLYEPLYTLALMGPKPHHASFYLDPERKRIAGRKFYFHHDPDKEPLSESKIIPMGGRPANRYIQPLDRDTRFHARIDFTNLEADEFGALLKAVVLEEGMRHKIGYGKPMGLGSMQIVPTSLKLIDYTQRYGGSGAERGMTELKNEEEKNELWQYINEQTDEFDKRYLVKVAMEDLRRIWRWPVDPDVDYYYPSKRDWFDTPDSIGKRIADTRNVP